MIANIMGIYPKTPWRTMAIREPRDAGRLTHFPVWDSSRKNEPPLVRVATVKVQIQISQSDDCLLFLRNIPFPLMKVRVI